MVKSRQSLLVAASLAATLFHGASSAARLETVRGDADIAEAATALWHAAPAANPRVLEMATSALACRNRQADEVDRILAIIDYSRPSTERRLWVFDVTTRHLLFEEHVAHGRNSGGDLAEHFSNTPGSLESSIGVFENAGSYSGRNGYSLRLRGLEPGFNDQAMERAIVIHGADYVNDGIIRAQGRLGRSFGCPAVRPAIARALIDTMNKGSFLFAYYPDPAWLTKSQYLGDCSPVGRALPSSPGPSG
ncbi:MAG: murein L,D-transpeptidase catalytic domain family protein [Dokdonella sp.]|uniref:murein L,D-transpeptidase catalytic domain family protein n=1 Tax=Dokdonella sp. TaxID=2291710 RepID=UPI003F7CDD3B